MTCNKQQISEDIKPCYIIEHKKTVTCNLLKATNKSLIKLYKETKGYTNVKFMIGKIEFELIESEYSTGNEPHHKFTFKNKYDTRDKTWIM